MAKTTRTVRVDEDIDARLLQLQESMTEIGRDNPEILRQSGEVSMSDVIRAVITTFMTGNLQHEKRIEIILKHNADPSYTELDYNYKLRKD